jgi:hypothetical protein
MFRIGNAKFYIGKQRKEIMEWFIYSKCKSFSAKAALTG